jgi:hypothetical protein
MLTSKSLGASKYTGLVRGTSAPEGAACVQGNRAMSVFFRRLILRDTGHSNKNSRFNKIGTAVFV